MNNLTWREGDVLSLPFADASFSIVATRFAFHHFLDPLAVLREMRRVCRPGGRVVVADTAPAQDKGDAFNHMECLRDPSHVHALSPGELLGLFAAAGLPSPCLRHDDLRYELESLLARSFPDKGNADLIRQLFAESLKSDSLGVGAVRTDGEIRFLLPTVIVVSTLPSQRFSVARKNNMLLSRAAPQRQPTFGLLWNLSFSFSPKIRGQSTIQNP